MTFPVTITFRDIQQSDFVEQHVQRKADKLAQTFPRILACDVVFDTVSVFVGQRRGAIRCVSGVCRQFPPFEGARLELVSRF
jgi:hypothetical protein